MIKKELRLNILHIFIVLYSIMMFSIWSINYLPLLEVNSTTYMIADLILFFLIILNIDNIIKNKSYRYIYFFILIYIIGIINFPKAMFGSRSTSRYTLDLISFSMYIIAFSLLDFKKIKVILISLLSLFSIYSVLGVIGAIFKFDYFFSEIPNILTDNFRYSSILTNPNALGEFSYLALIISLFLMVKAKDNKVKVLYTSTLIISMLGLLISMSRSAILMSGITFILLIVNYKSLDKYLKYLLGSFILGSLLVIVSLLIYDIEIFIKLFRLTQGLTGRSELWSYVLGFLRDNYYYGVGYHNSSLIFDANNVFEVTHAHNLYLSLMLEMGLFITILLIGYFSYIVTKLFKFTKVTNKYKVETYFLFIFFVSFLIGEIFEFSFFKLGTINFFVFSMFGVFFNLINNIKEEGVYKKKVTHVITGLERGGAEAMLYKLMKYRSDNYRYKVISLHDMGFYGSKLEEVGVKVVTINMNSKSKVFLSPFKLYYHLLGQDVVKTWLYHSNVIGSVFAKLAFVRTLVWGIRQSDFSFEHNSKSAAIMARVSKYISFVPDKIIANSDMVAKSHIDYGYMKSKFRVIYNGFEIDDYYYNEEYKTYYRNKLNISNDEMVFINVARFDVQKDHATLFRALNELKEKYQVTNFKLVLLGIGIEESNEELANLIKENNLTNEVILLGVRDDVNKVLSVADYFLLSSLGEGFPNVLGEAMATSLIPLATDVGDCKMIVGDSGFIVESKNYEAFSNTLYDIINLSDDRKKELRDSSRKRIEENFDIKVIVKKYEEAIGRG